MRPLGVCIPRTAASVNWRDTVCCHCSTYSRRCTACRCSPYTGHRLVSCSCHTVWTFCCVCTPLSLDSWLFYQVESWLKTMRLMLELVCFLMMLMFLSVLQTTDARTVAVISVHSSLGLFWTGSTHWCQLSSMFQKTASGHRRQPAFVDICRHMESSMSTPHLFSL